MAESIIIPLRPRYTELCAKDNYTHEDVIDILCAFAESLYPDIAPERVREIITENF